LFLAADLQLPRQLPARLTQFALALRNAMFARRQLRRVVVQLYLPLLQLVVLFLDFGTLLGDLVVALRNLCKLSGNVLALLGKLLALREQLYDVMWDDVGIVRDAASLVRASGRLDALEATLEETGVEGGDLAFNLTWHDWLNLKNLLLVSKSIRAAAEAREDSRGAHFRADFPRTGDLESSHYTCVRLHEERFEIGTQPVEFTRVRPGETLLDDQQAA
jgi:hypothetical protein